MLCFRCKEDKPESAFYRRYAGRQSQCIVCHKEYTKKHYQDHKVEYAVRSRKNSARYRKAIQKLKDKPCADCKLEFPYYVMDFDHVTGDKEEAVSRLASKGHFKRAFEEAKKCDVVCSNCHRIRTHERLGG